MEVFSTNKIFWELSKIHERAEKARLEIQKESGATEEVIVKYSDEFQIIQGIASDLVRYIDQNQT